MVDPTVVTQTVPFHMIIIDFIKELGLGVALAVGQYVIIYLFIKWMFKKLDTSSATHAAQMKEILSGAAEERKSYFSIIESFRKVLEMHTANAQEFHAQVIKDHCTNAEAHGYQRQEHREHSQMMNELCLSLRGAIEHVKLVSAKRDEDHKAVVHLLEKMIDNVEEQGKVLLRINGEKHA